MNAQLNDARLTRQFNKIVTQLKNAPSGSISQATQSKGAIKGAYRFFRNPKVKPEKLIQAHVNNFQLAKTSGQLPRYLCVSDSTELDYSSKRSAEHLGPLRGVKKRGMILHNSMVVSDIGKPEGLLKQDYLIRNEEDYCKWKQRKNWPIHQKESLRWLHHFKEAQNLCEQHPVEMVFVADREADIMDIYHARWHENMHFLIRSQHNRRIQGSASKLYQILSQQPQAGTYQIQIIHPQTLRVRKATLAVRFCEITISLSSRAKCKKHLTPLEVTAIEVYEINPSSDIDQPIRWVLLTSLPVVDFETARQLIRYYSLRWLIERYHYLLKSGGAQIEDLQMKLPHQLKNAITTYSITLMDIMKIRYLSEKQPDTSVLDAGITPLECEILYTYANKKGCTKIRFDKDDPPTIWEFCRVLGTIGGFIPSKRQPLPGLKILSRALQTYYVLLDAYDAYMSKN